VLATVRKSLEEARAHVGMVAVKVDVPNAQIKIDNEQLTQPTSSVEPWFVEPGPHVVRGRVDGYDDVVQPFAAEKGIFTEVSLSFKPPVTATNSVPAAQGQSEVGSPPVVASSVALEARSASDVGSPAIAERADQGAGGVDTKTVVVVSGAILASIGLGIGIAYGAKSVSASSDGDRLSASIREKSGGWGCEGPTSSTSADCDALASAHERYSSANKLSTAGFIGFGVVSAATLGAFLLWPNSKVNGATSLSVSPNGLSIRRAF
jgi:hypothetical protein